MDDATQRAIVEAAEKVGAAADKVSEAATKVGRAATKVGKAAESISSTIYGAFCMSSHHSFGRNLVNTVRRGLSG